MPSIVLLVPPYLTVVDAPLVHFRMIDTFWAVWLPAGASPFNVVVIKHFSSAIPIALFLLFQRLFLRGPGLSGAIKG